MTLIEFLLARIAEDEDASMRAGFGWGMSWSSETDDEWSVVHADGKPDVVGCEDGDVTWHIARHDPARVHAECEAKRLLVQYFGTTRGGYPTMTALLLAAVYADHPDYRQEWTP